MSEFDNYVVFSKSVKTKIIFFDIYKYIFSFFGTSIKQ